MPQSGRGTLDEEYLDWELVLDQPGPITTFTLDNLTPGQWLYRVKAYTMDNDSAMTYRLFYVHEPKELTVIRVDEDYLLLSWNGDPEAVNFTIMYTDDLEVDFQPGLSLDPDEYGFDAARIG